MKRIILVLLLLYVHVLITRAQTTQLEMIKLRTTEITSVTITDNMQGQVTGNINWAIVKPHASDVPSLAWDWGSAITALNNNVFPGGIVNNYNVNNIQQPAIATVNLQMDQVPPFITGTTPTTVVTCNGGDKELAIRFFKINVDLPAATLRVIEELKRRNLQLCFVGDIVRNVGYPIWDKAIVQNNSGNNLTSVFIPLAMTDSGYVDAYIEAKVNREVSIKLFRALDYQQYFPGGIDSSIVDYSVVSKYAENFLFMDQFVFGIKKHLILDNSLFNYSISVSPIDSNTSNEVHNSTMISQNRVVEERWNGITGCWELWQTDENNENWAYTDCDCGSGYNSGNCPGGSGNGGSGGGPTPSGGAPTTESPSDPTSTPGGIHIVIIGANNGGINIPTSGSTTTNDNGGGTSTNNGGTAPHILHFPTTNTTVGWTPILPLKDSTRTDTLQPTRQPCGDSAKSKVLDTIMKAIDSTSDMRKLRDSSSKVNYELGFSIEAYSSNGQPPYNFVPKYLDSGTAANPSVSAPYDNYTASNVHIHDNLPNIIISPSPKDLFALMDWVATDTGRRRNFIGLFEIFAGPGNYQFAIMTTSDSASNSYYNNTAIGSVIDTIPTINGALNPYLNNWAGDINNNKTPLGQFEIAINKLEENGYPNNMLNTYANVYMLQLLKIPIRTYIRDTDGKFKKMEVSLDSNGNPQYNIIICN